MTRHIQTLPDVDEAGRVLASLNDWRAIVFVLVFIIFVLLVERMVSSWNMRQERKEMRALAADFGTSASKVADALSSLSVEVKVLRLTTARAESVVASAVEGGNHA